MARPKSRIPGLLTFLPAKKIDTEELHYDINNIRTLHRTAKNQADAERILWQNKELSLSEEDQKLIQELGTYEFLRQKRNLRDDMNSLLDDIRRRGLQEELIINDKNIVIEGNQRLAVCKYLHTQRLAGEPLIHDFTKIKCKQIEPGTPQVDIDAYLANIHVAGKSEWDDYNQATLLRKLHEENQIPYDALAAITRKSKPTIIKKIEALDLVHNYHNKFSKDTNWSEKYPYFLELLKKELVTIRDDPDKLKKVMIWLYEKRITNSKDIRYLKQIFENPKAMRLLDSNGMIEAIPHLMISDPTVRSPTFKKVVSLTNVIRTFPPNEFASTINDKSRIGLLKELRKALDSLIKQVESIR